MSPSLCPVLLQPPRRIPRRIPSRSLDAGQCHCHDLGLVLQPHRPWAFQEGSQRGFELGAGALRRLCCLPRNPTGPPKAAAGFKGFLKGDKRTPLWRFPAPMENCSGEGKNRFCFTIMWSSAQGQKMQHQRRKNKYIMNEYAVIFRENPTAFA